MLKKAKAGKDPFKEPPRPRRKITDAEEVDPDLATVGRVLEGSKLYVISALFIISSSCSLVLAKVTQSNLQQAGGSMPPLRAFYGCMIPTAHPLTAMFAESSRAGAGALPKLIPWYQIVLPDPCQWTRVLHKARQCVSDGECS